MRYLPFLFLLACSQDYGLVPFQEPTEILPGDALDIVMVFDTSCSMLDDWSVIDYGLIRTIQDFESLGMDIQVAMTSMDHPDVPSIPDAYYQVWVELDTTADLGWETSMSLDFVKDEGVGGEWGFGGAIKSWTEQASWFRVGATPIFIMVGDEAEQTTVETVADPVPMTARQFRSLIPANSFVVSIVGPYEVSEEGSCADAAPNYHLASDLIVDVCTAQAWSIVDDIMTE